MQHIKGFSPNLQPTKHTLVKYVRNKRRQPIGVLVAERFPSDKNEPIHIGWSMCHRCDTFNKKTALKIAMLRMQKGSIHNVPHTMRSELNKFVERIGRYFKDSPIPFQNQEVVISDS